MEKAAESDLNMLYQFNRRLLIGKLYSIKIFDWKIIFNKFKEYHFEYVFIIK